jgi:anti-sigma regulatory factor (Ser/Thr protein kinase)
MALTSHSRYPVQSHSDVAAARRKLVSSALMEGWTEAHAGRLELVITELATNLVRHAGEGELLFSMVPGATGPQVEILAIDRGPGIPDLAAALQDGFSSAGGPGIGLGSLRRLSDVVDFYSRSRQGTVVAARLAAAPSRNRGVAPSFAVRTLQTCAPGELLCGDQAYFHQDPHRCLLVLADGLGHGPDAHAAAAAAVSHAATLRYQSPHRLLESMHQPLHSLRGAAVTAVEILLEERILRYASTGSNCGFLLTGNSSSRLVAMNGIIGHSAPTIRQFELPLSSGPSLLVIHSDGLRDVPSLEEYPGLQYRDSATIAAVLYRDFLRGRDDASVMVAQWNLSLSSDVL